MSPIPGRAVAAAHLWLEAGASDETPDEAGTAHFVEHLVFKGTARRGIGEAAAAIEGLGGDLNAWTSWDETSVHATVASGALPDALDVLFDMTTRALFDPAEVDRERGVVLEEIRSYRDDPDSVADEQLQRAVFGDHPYGRPIIGSLQSVAALDVSQMVQWWRRNWHSGRAILSVAGDADPGTVIALARSLSADWASGPPRTALSAPPPPAAPRIQKVPGDFGSIVVALGWPGPPEGHADLAALDVLVATLGGGAAARLTVRLELDEGVASIVSADASRWRAGGMISIGFQCGETETAIRSTLDEIARVRAHGPTGAEVTRARDGIIADILFAGETSDGVAADLAWSLARTGAVDATQKARAAVATVTPRQVRDAARRWLDPAAARVVVLDRELSKAALTRAAKPPPPRATAAPTGLPVHAQIGPVQVAVLPDESELVAVQLVCFGGQLHETSANAGVGQAWARTVTRGTQDLDAVAFSERADAIGAWLAASSGRSHCTLRASAPAAHTADLIDLVGGILAAPRFDPHDWRNIHHELLDDLAAQRDQPTELGSEAVWRALWPRHPWRLPRLGTEASLSRIGPRSLRAAHARIWRSDTIVIAICGGIDPDAAIAALRPWLEQASDPDPPDALPAPALPPRRGHTSLRAGQQQATVLIGARSPGLHDPMRTPLAVAGHLLDSQSGRLFLALRERRSLAYGVWAHPAPSLGGGTFQAGLSTEPRRAQEAHDALRAELTSFAAEGPTHAELDRATQMIHGLSAMRRERVMERAGDLAWATALQRPYALSDLRVRLAALRPADLRDAFAALDMSVSVTVAP